MFASVTMANYYYGITSPLWTLKGLYVIPCVHTMQCRRAFLVSVWCVFDRALGYIKCPQSGIWFCTIK